MSDDPNLATLRRRAEEAPPGKRQEAWADFAAKRKAEEARRDRARSLYTAAAVALGARVAKLAGTVVEMAEADDFGRAELRLEICGKRLWTRPVDLKNDRGYARVRDAISASRRGDCMARNWLTNLEPRHGRSTSDLGGVDQGRANDARHGHRHWMSKNVATFRL